MREVEAAETDEENKELTYRIGAILLPPEDLPSKEDCEKLTKEMNDQLD